MVGEALLMRTGVLEGDWVLRSLSHARLGAHLGHLNGGTRWAPGYEVHISGVTDHIDITEAWVWRELGEKSVGPGVAL